MATFTWLATDSSRRSTKTRIIRAQFGDGYSQRTPDGINYQIQSWDLTFVDTSTVISAIESFLETAGGYDSFDWTAPRDSSSKKWTCGEWSRSNSGGSIDSLSATFVQEFDL